MSRSDKPATTARLRLRGLIAVIALVSFSPNSGAERDAQTIWNSRCQQCHGNLSEFARERLWNIDGQLHGKRHAEDLAQFLRRHYLPASEIQSMREMLLAHARSTERFDSECGSCHGTATEFVENSLWVRRDSITSLATGKDIAEFLSTHRDLSPDDAEFFFYLLLHVGNAR